MSTTLLAASTTSKATLTGHGSRRSKVTRACDRCKQRKRRCNGLSPCNICLSYDVDCTYEATYRRGKLVRPSPQRNHHDHEGSGPPSAYADLTKLLSQPSTGGQRADRINDVLDGAVGQSSAFVFLKRAWNRFDLRDDHSAVNLALDGSRGDGRTTIFSYGDRAHTSPEALPIALPSAPQARELFALYFDFAMPTYRFLHRQTAARWLDHMLPEENDLPATSPGPGERAIIWVIMATSSVFKQASAGAENHTLRSNMHDAQRYIEAARRQLSLERGRPTLESVQARLAMCLYLLHASMPNTAWYEFGTTVQLAFVLGLHRNTSSTNVDKIAQECRKRTFWALVTLDTYMAVLLGRPNLVNDQDISQELPHPIDDEQLLQAQKAHTGGDRVVEASIWHARLARITKSAARSQMHVDQSEQHKLHVAIETTGELTRWRALLPTVLSGAVQPSSLIPIFRRQVVVLQLGYCHAVMLVTRPLLLLDSKELPSMRDQVGRCVQAAVSTLDLLSAWTDDGTTFAAFWLTQYVAFNAVSIIYVYIIQLQGRANGAVTVGLSVEELLLKAARVQKHFEEVAASNAPSLRYYAVLQELQRAVESALREQRQPDEGPLSDTVDASAVMPDVQPTNLSDGLDLDFWLQLDSFPFSDMIFDDMIT